jgi:Secretion system C-terminal sorting domain
VKHVLVCLLFLSGLFMLAEVINVPEDYPFIQEGVNAAEDGDEVIVSPGIYTGTVNFVGKAIILGSLFYTTQDTSYISQTVISGGSITGGVIFETGEDSLSVLTGFTISDGIALSGGGVNCFASSPSIDHVVVQNSAVYDNHGNGGGGIACVSASSPKISNVIIRNNSAPRRGGGMYIYGDSNPILQNLLIENNSSGQGGGIFCFNSSPSLENVVIRDNLAESEGGGILLSSCDIEIMSGLTLEHNSTNGNGGGISCNFSQVMLQDVLITDNMAARRGGGIYCNMLSTLIFSSANRCNIYLNNTTLRGSGSDIYTETECYVVVDTFTVLYPTDFHLSPLDMFTYDILQGSQEQTDFDLYVSPEGDNTHSGSSSDDALQTIQYACSIIQADSLNPQIIHLLEGTYSYSANGEFFPVSLPSYVSLAGVSENAVILDAENRAGVIRCDNAEEVSISNLVIRNGEADNGAGISCEHSSVSFENLLIEDNTATSNHSKGGGIYIIGSSSFLTMNNIILRNNTASQGGGIYSSHNSINNLTNLTLDNNYAIESGGGIYLFSGTSNLENIVLTNNRSGFQGGGLSIRYNDVSLTNICVRNNISIGAGGGIFMDECCPSLTNVTVTENNAADGGGIYFRNSLPMFSSNNRCNIYLNNSSDRGNGSDLYSDESIIVIVDTFTVMNPTDYHAYRIQEFDFDIQHGLFEQVAGDLYVSPDGDNYNSGLTAQEPLLTIQHAITIILPNPMVPPTIFLAEGVYSPTTNGEFFPISLPDNVTLQGADEEGVILDAQGHNAVISFVYSENVILNDLTICNGYNSLCGGGITMWLSSPELHNLTIRNNNALWGGGGVYCGADSNPLMTNITIINNYSYEEGGGILCYSGSNPRLVNVTIADNVSAGMGGGLCCRNSEPAIINSIHWGNDPSALFSSDGIPGSPGLIIAYSDIQGGFSGVSIPDSLTLNWLAGNLNAAPLLEDYQLTANSPCIDAGTAYFEYEGEVIVNLEENEYYGTAPDLGAWEYNPVEEDVNIIENEKLKMKNYPNPFNPETTIEFTLFQAEDVHLAIYNLKGQKIIELCKQPLSAGIHKYQWDGDNSAGTKVSSGVYFLNLTTETLHTSKKVLLIK